MTVLSTDRGRMTLAMLLLVAWNTTEFALQPVKRPLADETGILVCTLAILVLMFASLVSAARWPVVAALVASALHLAFGVFGVFDSPTDQGFGKVGPGVAALILAFAVWFSARALKERTA